MNDGNQHSGENPGTTAVSAQSNADWTLTYNLNLATSPGGYTINQIITDAVWTNDYAGQNYTLSYMPVGGSLTTVGTFGVQSPQTDNGARSTELVLSSGGTAPILYNVASLQFVFHGALFQGGFDQGAYTQITVTGTAVPEPATVALLALASTVGLAAGYRHRKASL